MKKFLRRIKDGVTFPVTADLAARTSEFELVDEKDIPHLNELQKQSAQERAEGVRERKRMVQLAEANLSVWASERWNQTLPLDHLNRKRLVDMAREKFDLSLSEEDPVEKLRLAVTMKEVALIEQQEAAEAGNSEKSDGEDTFAFLNEKTVDEVLAFARAEFGEELNPKAPKPVLIKQIAKLARENKSVPA